MNELSVKAQLETLVQCRIELANFTIEVNATIASGNVDKMLTVVDENGEYPVVTALGVEPLSIAY